MLKAERFSDTLSVLRGLRPSIFLRMVSLPNHALRGDIVFSRRFSNLPSGKICASCENSQL
jgi:hypothetical protein